MSQTNFSHLSYRPDIDGLRALAILSVVLFHAFPEWIHGGFIGVDIFFVISGYLISSIIFKGLDNRTFSFSDFYIRRIKRIFPALIIVLISCLTFGWFFLLSDEYQQLGKHIFGAATFTNNFILWNESGYFDNDTSTKPLLHLWSLSIEEQFYFLWPVLLWSVYKWKIHLGKVLLFLTISFTILHFYIFHPDRVAAFFAPYARFFELLVGASVAYKHLHTKTKNISSLYKIFKSAQSFIGLGLILTGIQIITKESHFPGYYALLSPVLGSALIIDSPKESILNKYLFSNKALVWIGLISYPLYLWHWPLLSFGNIIASQMPSLSLRIALVTSAILLASLTYYLIEKPIRLKSTKKSEHKALFLILCILILGLVGAIIYIAKGVENRKASVAIEINQGDTGQEILSNYLYDNFYSCEPKIIFDEAVVWKKITRCFQSKKNAPIDIAIIGDSHAEHLFTGLAESIQNKNIVYYAKSTLPTINNIEFKNIFKYVISDKNIKIVIINAYWKQRRLEVPKNSEFYNELFVTISALLQNNKKVIITDGVPFFTFNPKQCKYLRPLSKKNNCTEDKSYFYKKYNIYYEDLNKLRNLQHLTIVNTVKLFCDGQNCSMKKNGELLYRDSNHLNFNGSKYLASEIIKKYPDLAR